MFLNLFLVSLFLDMGAIQLLFPFLAKIYFQKIVAVLPILGLFADRTLVPNIRRGLGSKEGKILLFLLAWMILSVPFSIYPGGSFQFLTQKFWKVVVLVLLVLAFASSRKSLEKIIWTYILAVGFLGTITIMTSHSSRISIKESTYDPNDTALQFLLVLPFVFWQYRSRKGWTKLLAGFIALILIIGMVETQSRGGFLGLMAVVAIIAFQFKRSEKGGMLKIFFPLAVIGIIFFLYGGSAYRDRMETLFNPSADYNVTSQTGRIEIWKRGVDMMVHHPLMGVGVAGFVSADGRLYAEIGTKWNAAHNSFVQVGAELGFPGLIAFCLLIGSSMKRIRETRHSRNEDAPDRTDIIPSYSLIGSWIGFIVGGFFLSAAYTSSFFLLVALSIAFVSLPRPPKHLPRPWVQTPAKGAPVS